MIGKSMSNDPNLLYLPDPSKLGNSLIEANSNFSMSRSDISHLLTYVPAIY